MDMDSANDAHARIDTLEKRVKALEDRRDPPSEAHQTTNHSGLDQEKQTESSEWTPTQYEDYWCTTCHLKVLVSRDSRRSSYLPRMQYQHDYRLIPMPKPIPLVGGDDA